MERIQNYWFIRKGKFQSCGEIESTTEFDGGFSMIAIDFGNLCFNNSSSEQYILIVLAPKSEYSLLDEFVTKALLFLESDGEFYDKWTEMYQNRTYSPVNDEEKIWLKSRLDEMNQRVNILYESIVNVVHIIPPKWNDMTLGIETESEYIFYLWSTSA